MSRILIYRGYSLFLGYTGFGREIVESTVRGMNPPWRFLEIELERVEFELKFKLVTFL